MHGSYKELRVWQDAMQLAVAICQATESFPKHEMYGLTNQLRRAAVSVQSNIAEGKGRHTSKEFTQFLFHARGSVLEVETQGMLAERLEYLSQDKGKALLDRTASVARSLNALINAFRREALATND
jgi:four helix bundle protein